MYSSVYSVQFEHFPTCTDVQYRHGTQTVHNVGRVVVYHRGEKNGNVQDLIDFISSHSDEEEDDREKVVRRMKQKTGMLPGGDQGGDRRGGNGREAGHLGGRRRKIKQKEEDDTKHVDVQSKGKRLTIKLNKIFTQTTKPSFPEQYLVNNKKGGGKHPEVFAQSGMNRRGKGEDSNKFDQPRVRIRQKKERTKTSVVAKNKKLPQKKMKKIRKAVQSFAFGPKTNSIPVSDSVGLPSNLIEVRALAPQPTTPIMKVKQKKSSLKKVIRKKTKSTNKKESETQIRNIENINSSIKRRKNTKRQFKNPI